MQNRTVWLWNLTSLTKVCSNHCKPWDLILHRKFVFQLRPLLLRDQAAHVSRKQNDEEGGTHGKWVSFISYTIAPFAVVTWTRFKKVSLEPFAQKHSSDHGFSYKQACWLKFKFRDFTSCLCSAAAWAVCFERSVAGVNATETGNEVSQPYDLH